MLNLFCLFDFIQKLIANFSPKNVRRNSLLAMLFHKSGMNKMNLYLIRSSIFELQLGSLPLIKHDFWIIQEPILYGIVGIDLLRSNRLILNPVECNLTNETNGLAKLLTGKELSTSNMKSAKPLTPPVEPKIIEITSNELVEPSNAEKLPVPIIKSVNMACAEIYKKNSELENQRFKKPYLCSYIHTNFRASILPDLH